MKKENNVMPLDVSKIQTVDSIKMILKKLRNDKRKIVFTNGCFDILHIGHINYLKSSKQLGDILIVGVNSDESIKRLKGENRPINPIKNRVGVLEALMMVDYIIVFEEDTPLKLIMAIKPDTYTKGGDYDLNNVIGPGQGASIIEDYGGKVHLIPLTEDISTTIILSKEKNL